MKKPMMVNCILVMVMLCSFVYTGIPQVPMINLEQIQARTFRPESDTLLVVNFWATWCLPCVEELPYFLQSTKTFANHKVKIIFVSLDFLKDHNKVINFVKAKAIDNEVYHLNAGNPNSWIDKIDTTWGGSIPATVFYHGGKKILFHEGELNQQQLDSLINKTKL